MDTPKLLAAYRERRARTCHGAAISETGIEADLGTAEMVALEQAIRDAGLNVDSPEYAAWMKRPGAAYRPLSTPPPPATVPSAAAAAMLF